MPPRDDGRLAQWADTQRDVHALGHQIHDAIVEPDVQFDGRVAPGELGQRGQQQVATEGHRHVHAQPTLRLRARTAQGFLRVVDLVEDAARAAQVVGAFGGQAHPAGRAVQQSRTEVLFERRDVSTGRGARDVEFIRGLREGPAFGNTGKDTHRDELVHVLIVQESGTWSND